MTPIPLSRPPVDDEIKQAVLAAIDSRQYVLGPQCRQLEAELAAATGVKHAVLTSSATAALWLTLRALGVKAGDEILVPSHTAFPTVEAICLAEATPVFVDADEFYTLDPADAEAKATPRTVGIVPVHLYGQPVDLTAVQDLVSRLGLWLLEDCAQAQGAEWNGQRVGSFGRAAVFSFYPSKNLPGMGDGGAILTSDDEVVARCRRLRDHGRVDRNVHTEIGFNLRFNELQAAARGAGRLPEGARDPDRHPLSGPDPPAARDRAVRAVAAGADGAPRRGDPHAADVGRPRGRGDRSGDRGGARVLRNVMAVRAAP